MGFEPGRFGSPIKCFQPLGHTCTPLCCFAKALNSTDDKLKEESSDSNTATVAAAISGSIAVLVIGVVTVVIVVCKWRRHRARELKDTGVETQSMHILQNRYSYDNIYQ